MAEETHGLFLDELGEEESDLLTAQFGRSVVKFKYYVNRSTPEFLKKAQSDDSEIVADYLVRVLSDLVSSWDVRPSRRVKTPVKVTKQSLAGIPTQILLAMQKAINEDQYPPLATEGSS